MVAHVQQVLRDAGATGEVVHLADSARTAQEAADALGVEVGAIASSLVFEVGGNPVLVLTSGAHRVDTAKVAGLLGVPALAKATAAFVREHTGQAIGGVAPVGHPSRSAPWSTSRWPASRRSGPPPGTRTRSSPPATTSCCASPRAPRRGRRRLSDPPGRDQWEDRTMPEPAA